MASGPRDRGARGSLIARLLLVLAFLGPVESLDVMAQRAVQHGRSPVLEPVMRFASDAGKPVNVIAMLLGVAVLGGPAGVETVRLALLTAAPVNLLVEGLKRVTFRARPDGEHKRSNASFPSSHAANAFALAAVFARRWKRPGPVFWVVASIAAFSRIYLNRHFLSDVLIGAAIGVACAWMVARLVASKLEGRKGGAKGAKARSR